MKAVSFWACAITLAVVPAAGTLLPNADQQQQQLQQRAEREAFDMLMTLADTPAPVTDDPSPDIPTTALDRAALRLEMHYAKEAAREYWKAEAAAPGGRKLLQADQADPAPAPELPVTPVEVPPVEVPPVEVPPVEVEPVSAPRVTYEPTRPSAAEAAPYCTLEESTSYQVDSNNIPNAFVATNDAGECCAACYFRLDCFAWTFKTGVEEPGCYLRGKTFKVVAESGFTSGRMKPGANWVPPPTPPPYQALAPGLNKYTSAIRHSMLFFAAQRSGVLPANNPVPWRSSAHVKDPVPGGLYDAGDTLKLNFPLGVSASFLAWSMIEFPGGFRAAGSMSTAREHLAVALDFMLDCYDERQKRFIGIVGNPKTDLAYWGRPEEQHLSRPKYVWDATTPASDLLSNVAAAFASGSMAFKATDPKYAELLLAKAKSIYKWAISNEGKYTGHNKEAALTTYPSSDFLDSQAWAAAWLYRASGNKNYIDHVATFWKRSYGVNPLNADVYPSWDSLWAPTAVFMRTLARRGVAVPGMSMYTGYFQNLFAPTWLNANGNFNVVKTPQGMVYPKWNIYGNLQFATTVAMVMVQEARTTRSSQKAEFIGFARRQLDYALGITGRSYVVGWGSSPPVNAQHPGASCPDRPALCDNQNLYMKALNGQRLRGALVGGPAGARRNASNPDYYLDSRLDFAVNEPSLHYQAGFVGALAGCYVMLGGT